MALTINTNLSSLIVQSSLRNSTSSLNQAIERMSTGFKINYAKDNAAGYSIANSMSLKLSSYDVAVDNTSYGLELIGTATSSLDLITSHLQRIRDLAEQASNGTYGADSLTALQSEAEARMNEVFRIVSNTEYNGIKLFNFQRKVIVDEGKRVVNQTTFQQGETYYLTTSEDLIKLQDLVNSGVDTANVTFELASDIDMKGINFRGIGTGGGKSSTLDHSKVFKGTFNGNQYVIKNLTINTSEDYVGLFGYIEDGLVDSVCIENANITGGNYVGGIVGESHVRDISDSYATGSVTGDQYVGGLVGNSYSDVVNSYSKVVVNGQVYVGGLVGNSYNDFLNSYFAGSVVGGALVGGIVGLSEAGGSIKNSYSTGSVSGDQYVGGIAGNVYSNSISNSYVSGSISGNTDVGCIVGFSCDYSNINGYFDNEHSGQSLGVGSDDGTGVVNVNGVTSSELKGLIGKGFLPKFDYEYTYGKGTDDKFVVENIISGGKEFILQVGIDSSEYSTIEFDTMLDLNLKVNLISQTDALQAITDIDNALKIINNKQTELGSTENKLISVLDMLSINIENLASSLSTIQDADIAEESSEYIKAQILQQASGVLLSTVNQNPNIALQLL